MKHLSTTTINKIKYALFVACLLPFLKLIFANCTATAGPDPVAQITHITGIWALNLLLLTLAISPLRQLTHWNWLVRLRRTLALYAFFYSSLHLLAYVVFDQFFDWTEMGIDISRRPYLMAGMTCFVLMIPLVATSNSSMMKRMGGKHWQMLHRLAYPVAAAGVVHYFWLVKQDITNPSIYAIILLVLFCARLTKTRQPAQGAGRLKSLKDMKSA
jgi:sulfoxide reductase heme-binding subunit YedZ